MRPYRLRRPSPALVVATIALIVAMSGTGYAAFFLAPNSVGTRQLKDNAVTSRKIASGAVTGSKVKVSSLGIVPHARNADRLGGSPPSSYRSKCPSGLKRAPGSNLCYEIAERPRATWAQALATCALAGLRLPDPGELAEVFNDQGAVQDFQWTTAVSDGGSGMGSNYATVAMSQASNRQIVPENLPNIETVPFRCVTGVG
jgi:hypothetical protein